MLPGPSEPGRPGFQSPKVMAPIRPVKSSRISGNPS
jgi:hypothetical protein